MNKDPPPNIFDAAGQRGKGFAPKKPVPQAPAPAPAQPSSQPEVKNESIDEVMQRIRSMQKDLINQLEQIYVQADKAGIDVKNYFKNPKNFTPEQWTIISANREELEKKMQALLGKKPAVVKAQMDESKQTKARKGKTLGARRNWIPM